MLRIYSSLSYGQIIIMKCDEREREREREMNE